MPKKINFEKIIGKVKTSAFGPGGLYKVEDGVIKPLKEDQKEIVFDTKDLM